VALKVLQAGRLATPQEMDRFLREARTAAQLDHPHIVPIHDAGRASATCFLACAFVPGTSLAHRLAAGSLPFRQAATLVARAAEALHHAHLQGVIHRDVKPSNILLDGQGEPHLTDFGLERRDAGEITVTLEGDILGTPASMSPEQARGEGHRVDGRSDLYSLGVILYELLTRELPFRGNREMVLKQVLEEEPRPLRRLNDRIPRDLETICLKCPEKEPDRRSASAQALAQDLRRFLNGEPILARPVGRVERLGRWCRRNPWVAAFLVALVLGVIGSTWQAIRATGAERATRLAAAKAKRSESEALKSKSEAVATLEFFQKKVLAAARPKDLDGGLGLDATIRAAVDAAEPKIEKSFADQPAVEAAVRVTLGESFYYMGDFAPAIRQFEQAAALRRQCLGPDDPDTLASIDNLALAYRDAGRLADALPLFEETLNRRQATLRPDHPHTLISMVNLAGAYLDADRLREALPLYEETLKREQATLGSDHPLTLMSMGNLALAHQADGRLGAALPLFKAALKRLKAKIGLDHPVTLGSMNNLAQASLAGEPAEAESLMRECLAIREKTTPDDWRTFEAWSLLGGSLLGPKRYSEAEPLLFQGFEGMKACEAKIPAPYKKRLAEAGARII
jgi:tetratricopeptide (TPR) repeat protein